LFCQLNKVGGFQTDKFGRQFSGSISSKKQALSRSVAVRAT
jgi:hypothetical protein